MKIAFTSMGKDLDTLLDSTFGRTKYILIWDNVTNELNTIDNQSNAAQAHGVGPKTAAAVIESEAELIISGNMPGGNAMNILGKANIEIFVPKNNKGTLKEMYNQFLLETKN